MGLNDAPTVENIWINCKDSNNWGCEKMSFPFFTARFLPQGIILILKKGRTSPFPRIIADLCYQAAFETHLFIMVFIKIVTNRNQKNLHPHGFDPSSHDSLIPAVILHDPERTLCLYGTVHS